MEREEREERRKRGRNMEGGLVGYVMAMGWHACI
jgi:hypothetical protein